MIKLDIVNAVVTTTNISRTKAEQAVETVFESLKTALGRGQRIELRRFGVFSVKPRKTGIGRNPRTGEEVNIPPGKAVRFKPGKELQGLEERRKRLRLDASATRTQAEPSPQHLPFRMSSKSFLFFAQRAWLCCTGSVATPRTFQTL